MANRIDLVSILETAYELDLPGTTWLRRVLTAAEPALNRGLGVVAVPVGAAAESVVTAGMSFGDAGASERMRSPALSGLFRAVAAGHGMYFGPLWASPIGFSPKSALGGPPHPTQPQDVLVFTVDDGAGDKVVLAAPSPALLRLPRAAEIRRWHRVGAHIGAALRLRKRLRGLQVTRVTEGPSVGGIFSPEGQVLHAEGELAAQRTLRDAVREAVLRMERARHDTPRDAPDEALHLWRGLVSGTWSLIESTEIEGRRLLVAHKNEMGCTDPRALTARESGVLHLVEQGVSGKEVAYTLGLSEAAVSTIVRAILRKLGLHSRLDLVGLARAQVTTLSGTEGTVRVLSPSPPPPVAQVGSLTAVERQLLALVARGLGNDQIAHERGTASRTVANQLQGLYRKLGINSRPELMAWMRR